MSKTKEFRFFDIFHFFLNFNFGSKTRVSARKFNYLILYRMKYSRFLAQKFKYISKGWSKLIFWKNNIFFSKVCVRGLVIIYIGIQAKNRIYFSDHAMCFRRLGIFRRTKGLLAATKTRVR